LAEANRARIELQLPTAFMDYWIACFLAPYDRDRFDQILDPMPDGSIRDLRVYPPPERMWFDAGIDYSHAPATLVIEGPAALASSSILRAATTRALAIRKQGARPAQHPYQRNRQIGAAQEERVRARATSTAERSKAMRQARAWSLTGGKPAFIAMRLGQRGYKVSARTVSRWITAAPDMKNDTTFGHNEAPTANP
jgi:hypothetical protein